MLSRHLPALAIGAIALLPATVTHAETPRAVVVRFADLDLSRAADVQTLYRRIRIAAEDACEPRWRTGSIFELPTYRTCVHTSVSRAITQVDSPALTAYHQTRRDGAG